MFVFILDVQVVEGVLEASADQELERKVIDLLGALPVEGSVGVVERFNKSVSHRVGNCLVTVTLFEVETGAC